jgi:hypothetical protein
VGGANNNNNLHMMMQNSGGTPSGGGGGGGSELVFDVTSTLGTALVVALPSGCDAETLRRAIASEHEQCHPEYGAVTVKQLYGLRPVPEVGRLYKSNPVATHSACKTPGLVTQPSKCMPDWSGLYLG